MIIASHRLFAFFLTAACFPGVVASAHACNDNACEDDQSVQLLQRSVLEGIEVDYDDELDEDLTDEVDDYDEDDDDVDRVTAEGPICNLKFFEGMPSSSTYAEVKEHTNHGCSDQYSDNLCDSINQELFGGKDLDSECNEAPDSNFCKTMRRLFEADYDHQTDDEVVQSRGTSLLDTAVERKGSPRRRRRRRQPVRRRRRRRRATPPPTPVPPTPSPTPAPTPAPTPSPTPAPTPSPTPATTTTTTTEAELECHKKCKRLSRKKGTKKACKKPFCKGCDMCQSQLLQLASQMDDDDEEDVQQVMGSSPICNLKFFQDMSQSSSNGEVQEHTNSGCQGQYSDALCDSICKELFIGKDLDAEFSETPASKFCKTVQRLFEADYDHGKDDPVAQNTDATSLLDAAVQRKGSPRRRRRRRQPPRRRRRRQPIRRRRRRRRRRRTPAPTPSPTPAPTPSPTPAPTPAPTPSPTPATTTTTTTEAELECHKKCKRMSRKKGTKKACRKPFCKGCDMCQSL